MAYVDLKCHYNTNTRTVDFIAKELRKTQATMRPNRSVHRSSVNVSLHSRLIPSHLLINCGVLRV